MQRLKKEEAEEQSTALIEAGGNVQPQAEERPTRVGVEQPQPALGHMAKKVPA